MFKPGGEHQKCLCQVWNSDSFQRLQDPRKVLLKPKDQDPKEKKSSVIYNYQWGAIDCVEEYIGKTSRTLGECYREHRKEPSPIYAHSLHTGHQLSPDQFNIIGREDQDLFRLIKESIYIRVNNPTLNRNIGKFNLSHIWDRVLFSTPNLKTAFPWGYAHICS